VKQYIRTFERHEIKYCMTTAQRLQIERELNRRMREDSHGRNTIMNLYFDTPDMRIIRRSLERPVYKEKLRLRSYLHGGDTFLELKKKYRQVVYKRRTEMTEAQAMEYICRGEDHILHNQITDEIDYFLKFYEGLRPAVFIAYDRTAYLGTDDADLRVTFDENLRWRSEKLNFCEGCGGRTILEPGLHLMEVKIANAMPLWLSALLSELGIYKTSFSKYGRAYGEMLKLQRERGHHCA